MTSYLLKTTLCSALLLVVYFLVLEKQSMYRFNRFYLLLSLVFSAIVPLVSIELSAVTPLPFLPQIAPPHNSPENIFIASSIAPSATTTDWLVVVVASLYGLTAGLLLLRFGRNVYTVLQRSCGSHCVDYQKAKIVLVQNKIVPHSFWKYLFLNQDDYRNGRVKEEILCHELAHIHQKHSLDVLFVELLLVVAWFNPVLYLYRKAILLNHEFLADQAVVNTYHNPTAYQYLLLNTISQTQCLFISPFNYLITKKRLVMMNKTTTTARMIWAQLAIVAIVVVAIFIFSDLSIAQTTINTYQRVATNEGVSEQELDQYRSLISKYVSHKGKKIFINKVSDTDNTRLTAIYLAMSKAQQASQDYIMLPPGPLPPNPPTEAALESYKNSKVYGVWIDEKKVANTALNNYKAADFDQVFVSKLYPNAQKTIGYKYKFQVNLGTKSYYVKYRKEALASPKRYYIFRNLKKMKTANI
jgi:bla regulator protein blaR1